MPQQKTLYAVLIGINGYNRRPLSGCINDAVAVSDYFEKLCKEQEDAAIHWKPVYLLEPGNEQEKAWLEGKGMVYQRPTRQNIIDAFSHFQEADAEAGDHCLLYYSGHGSYMEAPEVFQDIEPTGAIQTIVCVDSREPGNRDLLDKELGYLISRTLEGKTPYRGEQGDSRRGVHFLAIMDCCHSGSNTRNDEPDLVARMEDAGSGIESAGQILGFTTEGNCFYRKFSDGQSRVRPGGLQHARYINLAAARDSELAQEKTLDHTVAADKSGQPIRMAKKHGIFTYSLLNTLEQSGANISYRELMRRVEMEVRSRVDRQIPVLGSTEFEDDNLLFLRNEFTAPRQEYAINWRTLAGKVEWYLNAGAIQGIVPSLPDRRTRFKLSDGSGRSVEALEVRASESVLSDEVFTEADKANKVLRAVIEDMPFPRVQIGYGQALPPAMRQSLGKAWQAHTPRFVVLAAEEEIAEYEVKAVDDGDGSHSFILTRPGSEIPLFVRHRDASTFLSDLDKVGRWESVARLSNPRTGINRQDIRVEAKVLEGIGFGPSTLNDISDSLYRELPADPDVIEMAYRTVAGETLQPALKLRITNTSSFDDYWIGALYLDSQFGITHEYLPPRQVGWESGQDYAELGYAYRGVNFQAIPLAMDDRFQEYGITEIQDYLILFVAKKPFDLARYYQQSIELDSTRSVNFDNLASADKEDWMTIKVPIRIHRPLGVIPIQGGQACSVAGMKIETAVGFSASAQLTTRASALRLADRWADSRAVGNNRAILPPGHLWAQSEGSEAVFSRSLATAPENHLSILELTRIQGAVSPAAPFTIDPGEALAADEAIIPFGYDQEADIYFPLGYTNGQGRVVIQQLPPETPGLIGATGLEEETDETGRALLGSVKLFFHKIIWSRLSGRHDYNMLTLIQAGDGKKLNRIRYRGKGKKKDEKRLARIREALGTAPNPELLLLLHGFVGDSKDIVEAVFNKSNIHQHYGAVLAFDYENLATPIEETAVRLLGMLRSCGLEGKRLTVLGSSMGGLVARCLVEQQAGGADLVKRVVQVGSPNAGSELSDFTQKLNGWLTMAMNGADIAKPHLAFFAFLWKGLEQHLFHTLEQLSPSSPLIAMLKEPGSPAPVPYYLLSGDTASLGEAYQEEEPSFKKVWKALRSKGKYLIATQAFFDNEPNDMIVKVSSMNALPGGHQKVEHVVSDHLSYYKREESLRALERLLG